MEEMNIGSFMPVKIVSGKGCVKNNARLFLTYGKRCIIITGGKSAILSGALDDCTSCLNALGIEYMVFDKIEQNPQTKTCMAAGECARTFNADFVIGIGGGSPLDASKAVAIYACNSAFSHDDIYKRNVPSKHLPVLLIGTTAGTGSEVTGVSVLTNSESGLKKSISGDDCYADVSFCDYSYTKTVPRRVTLSTALDAFCHAVESYFASTCNELTVMYSLKALTLLKDYIMYGCKNESLSEKERERLYIASIFAGLSINVSGTCFPHTVGYYLTENYNIPHGFACAEFMPVFLERAKKYCPEKTGAIESIFDCKTDALINHIKTLASTGVKIDEAQAKKVSQRWKDGVKNFDRTPGGFTFEDACRALCSL